VLPESNTLISLDGKENLNYFIISKREKPNVVKTCMNKDNNGKYQKLVIQTGEDLIVK
jgi:hypothetical protein